MLSYDVCVAARFVFEACASARFSVRHKSLPIQRFALVVCLALSSASALAQSPAKEPFPFDWLRHDAAPANRAAGSTFYPPLESLDAQKRRQQIEPAMEEPQVMAAPLAPPVNDPPAPDRDPQRAEPSPPDAAPMPTARPAMRAGKPARAHSLRRQLSVRRDRPNSRRPRPRVEAPLLAMVWNRAALSLRCWSRSDRKSSKGRV